MSVGGCAEGREHDRGGDGVVGSEGEHEAGAVIQPGQDLNVAAVFEGEVGEVGLPALIRQVCLEAGVGGLRSFLRFGGDEVCAVQGAPDRGGRDGDAVVVVKVPGEGVGAGVQAAGGELVAQPDDEIHHVVAERGRGGVGCAGAGFEGGVALDAPSGDELGDPAFGDAVGAGGLGLGEALDGDGGDDQAGLRHAFERGGGFPVSWDGGFLCPETRHCQPD